MSPETMYTILNARLVYLAKGLPSPPVEERAQQPLAVVHVDLWGPASTASHGGCTS